MYLRWLGHSCFEISSHQGTRVLTDPFNEEVGYPLPQEQADIVTISHEHYDHNAFDLIPGTPEVICRVGVYRIKDAVIEGVPSYHDDQQGKKRGANIIFLITVDGIRVCHLGDLGHMLNQEDISRLGTIDVLLLPVGGIYTIDARQAYSLSNELSPRIVIPMHYKTPALKFSLDPVTAFTVFFNNIEYKSDLELTADRMPSEMQTVVLSHPN